MADNIKIVGEILNIEQKSRYDENDLNLLSSQQLKEDFGKPNDYIEYLIYDAGGNLLNIDYSYQEFKLSTTSYVDPTNGALPVIEIDPVKDIQNQGYTSGEFQVQYNFFNNKISSPSAELFIKEISSDRTEIRVGSTILSDDEIEKSTLNLINESTGSTYFVDYLLNFGFNNQAVAVNVALNRVSSGYEILFKLYKPLEDSINEKDVLWVVKEKVEPYLFNINLDKLILPEPGIQLRGPNFDIEIPNQNNFGSSYQNYNQLLSSFKNVSSSYQQLLSLVTSQSIDINIDYNNFSNFTFFGSATQRVTNFYNKVKEIEDYKNNITLFTPKTSSFPNLINDYNLATASIDNIISNFDGFEYYMYFESGSLPTSSYDFLVSPYPKSNSTKPFTLASTASVDTQNWYSFSLSSAEFYDIENPNILTNSIPSFLADDENNAPYLTFLNMVGHYFDNIWIFLKSITDINRANNNLDEGISKDLVYYALQSLGVKLYNKYSEEDNVSFLVGQDSGSIVFDNNFTPTGSYLNNIPRKDLLAETYKRIYHNLPLLLKTKGTSYGLQTLISTFGITGSILNVKEYGGDYKFKELDEFNTDKIRITTSSIVPGPSGSILSPHISVQSQPTVFETEFISSDLHYVDVSFSPQTQIDLYASASITATTSTWSLDDYIGNPGELYSSSYSTLDDQRKTYYNFTASYLDYAGFIRLIQFFDNSLFKMLKDFTPARANLSTGITISSPVLERNKFAYANPSSTTKLEIKEGTIEGPTIGTEYTDLYYYLTGSKAAYYNGELEGDTVNYNDIFNETNFNPYLEYNTASWNVSHPSNSININAFNHSDFNILLNNVYDNRLSNNRKLLQPIYVINSPLRLAGYSSSYYAELQDSYESLKTYQLSRYEGTKIFSLKYNIYTSASSDYEGDNSFGKSPTIDKNVRKIGIFTEVVSSSFLPRRNRASLKYLVDESGSLTELNLLNKNWQDVQRTYVLGDTATVTLFDNQIYSNQKTTDGIKPIFDSGYTYSPILYFAGCASDPKIYFENLGGSNSYLVTAYNSSPLNISGSSTVGHPISSSYIPNIFDVETQDLDNIYAPGTLNSFPSYSVEETANYSVQASFDLTLTLPNTNSATWSLEIYKNNDPTPLFESENIYYLAPTSIAYKVFFKHDPSTPGNTCSGQTTPVGYSSKNVSLGQYLTTGDQLYSDFNLTIPYNITGYFAQIGNTVIYEITNGVLGSNVGTC